MGENPVDFQHSATLIMDLTRRPGAEPPQAHRAGVVNRSDGNIGIPSGERELENGTVTSFAADINYRNRKFNLAGEYIGRCVNPDMAGEATAYDYGFRVRGAFFVVPKKVELASRYEMVMFDDGANVAGGNDLVQRFAVILTALSYLKIKLVPPVHNRVRVNFFNTPEYTLF